MFCISVVGELMCATAAVAAALPSDCRFPDCWRHDKLSFCCNLTEKGEKKGPFSRHYEGRFFVLELAAFARALEIDQCRSSAHFVNSNRAHFVNNKKRSCVSIYGSGGELGIDLLSLSHTHTCWLLLSMIAVLCFSLFWTEEEKAVRDFFPRAFPAGRKGEKDTFSPSVGPASDTWKGPLNYWDGKAYGRLPKREK